MPLPQSFIDQMQQTLGTAEAEALCHALQSTDPCTSIRINPNKRPEHLPAEVKAEVPWCGEGRYLAERPMFTTDPLLHAGCYYVQEASFPSDCLTFVLLPAGKVHSGVASCPMEPCL